MKRAVLFIVLALGSAQAQITITPAIAGSSPADSVIVSFCTFDTTMYPRIADADSIIALRFGPGNALVDSLTQSSPAVRHPRSGWYQVFYRAANAGSQLGLYRVFVRVKIGGAWRGAAAGSYQVIGNDIGGYFADIAAAVSSSVSGAYACTLFVFDSGSTSAISGAFVRLLNSDQTAVAAMGSSDQNGRLLLALNDHSYRAFAHLGGYSQTAIPAPVNVNSAGANDTIWMTRFDPGRAPSANLCRVYGYVQSLDGQGIAGATVTARIAKSPLLLDGIIISPFALTAATDSSGYWYLDLIPNGELEPGGTKYDITLHYPSGTIMRRQLEVPVESSCWMRW